MKSGWALIVLAGLALAGPAAAQPVTGDDILKKMIGRWAIAGTDCAMASLIVTADGPYEYRFSFAVPVKRDQIMHDVPPPPRVVGIKEPPTTVVEFSPKENYAPTGRQNFALQLPDSNSLAVKFMNNGKIARYRRCAAGGVS